MPKCAGSSMRGVFRSILGAAYCEDYASFFRVPLPSRYKLIQSCLASPVELGDASMIFGHFFPVKYLGEFIYGDPSLFLATFLRDPLDRLVSHYAFWRQGRFPDHYLWCKMISEDWSFERFALSGEMQNFYAQHLVQVPLSRFDYIGIHESISSSWTGFLRAAGLPFRALPHENRSKDARGLCSISDETRSEIVDFHAEDYFIYNYALGKFASGIGSAAGEKRGAASPEWPRW